MKFIINESQSKRLIKESRYQQLSDFVDQLTSMIYNYDQMDCYDKSQREITYVQTWCKVLEGASLEELMKLRDELVQEMNVIVRRYIKNREE